MGQKRPECEWARRADGMCQPRDQANAECFGWLFWGLCFEADDLPRSDDRRDRGGDRGGDRYGSRYDDRRYDDRRGGGGSGSYGGG
jgi:hypothetical protein